VDGFVIGMAPDWTLGLPETWLEARLGPEHASRRTHLELAAEAKGARREVKADLSFWHLLDKSMPHVLRATGMLAPDFNAHDN
jgi:hypothetical protein